MKGTRRIGAIDQTGHGCVITGDIPEVKKGMLLVKVHASLISPGTELVAARQARKDGVTEKGTPRPFGYQNAGDVIEVGEGVTEFKPGDRVACMGGGFAYHSDYAVVPQKLCCLLPENVSYEEGAYAHLAITSMHAVRRAEPVFGEYMLVVGMGLVGQMAARLGQIAGCYVMGWDMCPFRLDIAKGWGIDGTMQVGGDVDFKALAKEFTRGKGFDLAVMAFGGDGSTALQNVRDVMKVTPDTHQMGRLAMVGGLKTTTGWGATLGNLDLRCCARTGAGYHDGAWELGEYDYPEVFMRWTTRTNMELALRYMSEGKFNVKCLTSHRFSLDQIGDAIDAHINNPNSTLGTIILFD